MNYKYSDSTEKDQKKLLMLLEKKRKSGSEFIPRLKEGERACVKPSATSTLPVPFRGRK